MKRIQNLCLFCMIFLCGWQNVNAQVSFGQAEKFNNDWRFIQEDAKDAVLPTFDDSKWRRLELPHDWSIEGQMSPTLASCTGYLPGGIGWYRKTFEINEKNKHHYIYFEGVYNRSEVYLNGQLLGKRPNGYISFMYDMTPYLKEGKNVLAVRVDHSRYADSRWYTGSGIYRDVWMVKAGDLHFAQWGVSWQATKITNSQAIVKVNMEVVNEEKSTTNKRMSVRATLYDADNKQVSSQTSTLSVRQSTNEGMYKQSVDLKINKPKRWDLKTPYLYTLKTEVLADGKVVDSSTCRVGLRTLEFDANKGFALNGEWMKVKGVCLHHDAGVLGSVVPRDVWERRLRNLKEMGANAIRMSHNPQAPDVYDLCDELGLLVMDEASDEWEFPKRKWMEGWNVGTPSFDGTYDFFEEWIEQDVTDMVRRDRNHPCVFLWSIGNEVDYPNDPYSHPVLDGTTINQPMFGGYKPDAPDAMRIGEIAKRLTAKIKEVDTSRPVTGALAGVVMSNQTAYPSAVDVVGYNYTENRYDEDHATYPNRIIYGSETHSSYEAWKAVRDREHIFGQFIWTGTDYLGESGRWPSRGLHTGLLDFGSFKKPRGWFRASIWSEKPVTYIGTYTIRRQGNNRRGNGNLSMDATDLWNYREGQTIRVVCYTNSPQARLLLNGEVVGEMKP
ncbi:MAG: glycoside hydrolase family 2 [Bacteroidaceae bacterium]|nr:glycoside hydrolase family 2 [Bacteroidaceae bacterium]